MNKQTKMLLGLGAVAVVGYYFYTQSQKKSFVGDKISTIGSGRYRGCKKYMGNVKSTLVGTRVNAGVIRETGNGFTIVC